MEPREAGRIVILNGAPRSGKSSIAAAIQGAFDGVWMSLGTDVHAGRVMPERLRPGIGLRPGGERPDLEALLPAFYAALYGSIAAHSRLGLNVVADVGHHDGYSRPLGILPACARLLSGLPVLFVGVRCPLDVVMARRRSSGGGYLRGTAEDRVPAPVRAWQEHVHAPGLYDVEVDTSTSSPEACADLIGRALRDGTARPTAFERLAASSCPPSSSGLGASADVSS